MEEKLTPEDSFGIINKAISNYKMNYKENAQTFLLWGWMLSLASFSNYIILKVLHKKGAYELMGPYSFGNWFLFISVGFIIQYFILRKIIRNKKVFSYLDDYMTKLWWATAAGFFVAIFICIKLGIAPPPIMLLIAGIATTTSGLLIKFKPLVFGGIAFFVFSIAATYVTNENISLVTGAAIICGYLIPGYFLKTAKE